MAAVVGFNDRRNSSKHTATASELRNGKSQSATACSEGTGQNEAGLYLSSSIRFVKLISATLRTPVDGGINPDTEGLLLETKAKLFELNSMTQNVLAQLKFFIGN